MTDLARFTLETGSAAEGPSRRPSPATALALGTLAFLVAVSFALPSPALPSAVRRAIPDVTIPSPRLDAGRPAAAAALATPLELAVAGSTIPLPPALLADLGGVALRTGAISSLRLDADTLAELLGPELLASLNRRI